MIHDISRTTVDFELPPLAEKNIETLEQKARDLARSVEALRQQTLSQSNARIEALEQKARNLARFVETTRQKTLLESDRKTEALEQKARDLADFVETIRNQTLLQSEAEIEALGQKARDLARSVESVRKETRLQSALEIAALSQQAKELAISVESAREETLLHSETEIAALGQQARDLAESVESEREVTLLDAETEIAALGQQARDLAESVESEREATLLQTNAEIEENITAKAEIKDLKQQAVDVARSVENTRLNTLIASDMAVRKLNAELEQRVLERTGQLEAANKELESFSYSVSHDLRAPLRAIDGFSRILLEDYAASLPEEGLNFLTLVRTNTQQMSQLVDDLLAFSRLGRLGLTKQTVHPAKIVRQCLSELQAEQENRQIEIEIGELPSCQADPVLLKQVWTNLLSNALKYTRKQEQVCIEIGCRTQSRPLADGLPPAYARADTETVYFVKDNGAGFDMKYVDKLFGVFQRLHRVADYEGTGVGLAIAQRIVFRHGGRIWGESEPNQGATFSFTLN